MTGLRTHSHADQHRQRRDHMSQLAKRHSCDSYAIGWPITFGCLEGELSLAIHLESRDGEAFAMNRLILVDAELYDDALPQQFTVLVEQRHSFDYLRADVEVELIERRGTLAIYRVI